ncbi:MAG: multi-sensor hybrid histidine kinase [Cyanobacteria bacterium RYN_339]|nr:multi-sensor hybrid histidine kinase [Cyanobacteria bacterium RYN_339]
MSNNPAETERLRAELAKVSTQLAECQRLASLGTWRWDIAADVVEWSDELYRLFGRPKEAGAPTFEGYLLHVHPDDRAYARQCIEATFERCEPFAFEHRVLLPGGGVRWMACRGAVHVEGGAYTHMFGTAQDVTALRCTEQQLADEEGRLRAIAEETADAIMIRDLDGKVVWANRRAALFSGVQLDEMVGMTDAELYDAALLENIRATDRRVLEERARIAYEWEVKRVSGVSVFALIVKYPYFDPAGELAGLITVARDITARKAMEEDLARRNEELLRLDQLKSQFVSSVAHELRTPLTTVKGYLEFLEDAVAGEPATGYVDQASRGVRRLQALLDDLLDFALLDAGKFKLRMAEADLHESVHDVVTSLVPVAREAGVELAVEAGADRLELSMDPGRIAQVLLNLLNNAIRHTPRGGSVVTTLTAEAAQVRVQVRDPGVGIDPQDHERLFQRFSQLETAATGGIGLGLSISKAIVEAHGGQIGITSARGEGSTFWFALPR